MTFLTDIEQSTSGVSVSESAFQQLVRLITLGTILPGADVTEGDLAASLDISRTPLRDAVRRLEGMGLLTRRNNRTLFVPALSANEMWDLSLTREALEVGVVREVARRVKEGSASLERLEAIHARMKQLATLDDNRFSLDAGLNFHRELYQLSQLQIATTMLNQIMIRIERYRQLTKGNVARSQHVLGEHDTLIDALRIGNEDKAEAAMRAHTAAGRAIYLEKLGGLKPHAPQSRS